MSLASEGRTRDLDTLLTPGVYFGAGSSFVNTPPGTANFWHRVEYLGYNSAREMMTDFAYDTQGNKMYIYTRLYSGTWGDWHSLNEQIAEDASSGNS